MKTGGLVVVRLQGIVVKVITDPANILFPVKR